MRFLTFILLLAACGGGGGSGSGFAIFAGQTLVASVTIITQEAVPGTFIDGPGNGPGGGPVCGNIEVLDAYRTGTRVVFRIEMQNGFCFDTDRYEIVLREIVFGGNRGSIILSTRTDPNLPGNVNGRAFFVPLGGSLGSEATALSSQLSQWQDDPAEPWVFLSLPLAAFGFNGSDNSDSVYVINAQVERTGTGIIDGTDPVNVDLVDPN